jgi:hypothetical protein
MRAAAGSYLDHAGAMIDPEFGIALAETDRGWTRYQTRKTERRQRDLVKPRRPLEITDRNGDVIDHGNLSRTFRAPTTGRIHIRPARLT